MAETSYWFCVKHHTVEEADGCAPIDRLGPYPSYAEAERALEKAAERNAEWERQDAEWEGTTEGRAPSD